MTREKALKLRELILQVSNDLSDEDAFYGIELFQEWEADKDYVKDNKVRYNDLLYKLIPDTHHSQSDWTPDITPAIWKRIDDPAEEWPEWRQPTGAHDAYKAGAKVSHNGFHWINTYGDGNNWEPGVFGWEKQE